MYLKYFETFRLYFSKLNTYSPEVFDLFIIFVLLFSINILFINYI